MKRILETNKLPHKEGHHAALSLTCQLCARTSQTVFINKTTGGTGVLSVQGPTVSWSALIGGPSAWSCQGTWYERVLCETVNWYIVDSVTVASYSHTPSTLTL